MAIVKHLLVESVGDLVPAHTLVRLVRYSTWLRPLHDELLVAEPYVGPQTLEGTV